RGERARQRRGQHQLVGSAAPKARIYKRSRSKNRYRPSANRIFGNGDEPARSSRSPDAPPAGHIDVLENLVDRRDLVADGGLKDHARLIDDVGAAVRRL